MSNRRFCFVGSTLDAASARQLLPGAIVLPPAVQGDLLKLDLGRNDTVIIIDGGQQGGLPLRHREIAYGLGIGATIVGTAAAGALRAVELRRYGMKGSGVVFRLFRSGALSGDDEIACVCDSQESGFARRTEPLVNIRVTLREAARQQVITPHEALLLIDVAIQRAFWQRTYPEILDVAVDRGLDAARARRLQDALPALRRDVLREDAVHTLQVTARSGWRPGRHAPPSIPVTIDLKQWREDARLCGHRTGVTEADALLAAQILSADYPELHHNIALECIAAHERQPQGDDGALLADAAAQLRLSPEELEGWFTSHDLSVEEALRHFRRRFTLGLPLMGAKIEAEALEELAVSNARRHGIIGERGVPEHALPWLSVGERDLPETAQLAKVLTRAFRLGRFVPLKTPFITALKLYGDFSGAVERSQKITSANQQFRQRNPQLRLETLAAEAVLGLFARRWGKPEEVLIAVSERGLIGPLQAVPCLRRGYLYARTHAADPPWSCLGNG